MPLITVLDSGKVISVQATLDKNGCYSYQSPRGWGVSFNPQLHFISETLDTNFDRTFKHVRRAGITYRGDWSFIRDAEPEQLSDLVKFLVNDPVIMDKLKSMGLSSYEMGRTLAKESVISQ